MALVQAFRRADGRRRSGLEQESVAALQGFYYLVTGVWPLVHMDSFERVTGPKTDRWLVRTVGVLVGAVGASLAAAGLRRRVTPELRLLAGSSALGLSAIDLIYVARGRISEVYLLDAAAELLLAAAWGATPQGPAGRSGLEPERVALTRAAAANGRQNDAVGGAVPWR